MTIREKIEQIIDRHTLEWKAGHNHLISEQLEKLFQQEVDKAVRASFRQAKCSHGHDIKLRKSGAYDEVQA